jgi:hypothetical protein
MKRLSVPAVLLAMALSAFSPAAAAAAQPGDTGTTLAATGNCRVGGAAALVNVVAGLCNTEVLNNSLNNLLQNADIDVLNNILNNSPILNDLDLDITITDVDVLTGGIQIAVLGGTSPVIFIPFP